jgi:pyridoxal phosphate enzyme (YggS family)
VAPPSVDELRERHATLLARLRSRAEAAGHDPQRLRIVGVTKGWPADVARAAIAAGMTMLGESRVQEAAAKISAMPDAEWHLIGHLQSNKARRAVGIFPVIHSVAGSEQLDRLDAIAAEEGRAPRLLLQVNVSGEASKEGMPPDQLAGIRQPEVATLVGLMTIAPMGADEAAARAIFARLRALRDALEDRLGTPLPELSMGMSADADAAAAEGATLVRIGTALFGPRG